MVLLLNAMGLRLIARLHANLFSLMHMCITCILVGIQGYVHFFIFLVIIASFFQYPPWQNFYKYSVVGIAALSMVLLELFLADRPPVLPPPPESSRTGPMVTLINLLVFIPAFMYYNQRILLETEARLAAEQSRAEALLHNILPAPIVERLKESRIIADSFPEATVLFSDIVGFTGLAAGRSPEELIALLNQIFTSFDWLVEKRGLEKIKTIGDAYMVAGGLPLPRADHLEAICDLALEMLEAVRRTDAVPLELNLRIGIHTGPVAAGVIGLHKFSYDLWGDTVNTASRMESHGESGRIQVTEVAYERLRDLFVFESSGRKEIKGKGWMQTYYLLGRHNAPG
ncbi:MAG: adenylate/guanylate cyclase domain-containing protein [Spirochaetales bacterium]|nr:adenylate/guanylate cyclase domain-containing protein [Spirochaetales bacterium]